MRLGGPQDQPKPRTIRFILFYYTRGERFLQVFFLFFLKFSSKKEKNRYFLNQYFYFQRRDAIKTVFAATNSFTVFSNAAYLFFIAPKSLRVLLRGVAFATPQSFFPTFDRGAQFVGNQRAALF